MTLTEIESAVAKLPVSDRIKLLDRLSRQVKSPDEATRRNSVLDIPKFSVGKVLTPFNSDNDILDEMLEDRL